MNNKVVSTVKSEPVVSWATLLIALNAIQGLVISMPVWAHTAIMIVTTIVAALAARQNVTPNSKLPDPSDQQTNPPADSNDIERVTLPHGLHFTASSDPKVDSPVDILPPPPNNTWSWRW